MSSSAAIVSSNELPYSFHAYEYTISGYRLNYSFKKAILSLFDSRHNEFWMIWSDIFPCMYFCMCYSNLLMSEYCLRIEFHLLYFGLITSRACSAIYHIFNCLSCDIQNRLIYLDLIGISNMALSTPVIYLSVFNKVSYNDFYITFMFSNYALSLCVFMYSMIFNVSIKNVMPYCQAILVFMAFIACSPFVFVNLNMQLWNYYVSMIVLSFGFVIYITNFPERLMNLGAADGRIWNSHVLWHCFVSLSQYFYIYYI